MDANLHRKLLLVTQGLSVNIALHTACEVCHSHRMVTAQQSIINVFLDHFKPTTGHIGLPHSLYLLKPMLFTKRIETVVHSVKQFNQLSARVLLHDLVKTLNVDKNDSDFTLRL